MSIGYYFNMKNNEESSLGKLKRLIGESEEIRKGNLSGQKKHMAKKMNNAERLKKHSEFVKKNPNKHSPYVKYEDGDDNHHKEHERREKKHL